MELIEEVKPCSYKYFEYRAKFKDGKQWYNINVSTEDDRVVFNINNKMFTEKTNRDDYLYILEYIRNDISNNELLIAIENTFKRVKEK